MGRKLCAFSTWEGAGAVLGVLCVLCTLIISCYLSSHCLSGYILPPPFYTQGKGLSNSPEVTGFDLRSALRLTYIIISGTLLEALGKS